MGSALSTMAMDVCMSATPGPKAFSPSQENGRLAASPAGNTVS